MLRPHFRQDPRSWPAASTFLHGSAESGWAGGLDLFLACGSGSNRRAGSRPVFVRGADSDLKVGNLNLWVGGSYPTLQGGVDLAVWNGRSGVSAPVPLFFSGSDVTAGPFRSVRGG